MPKNVHILRVGVRPSREKNFVPIIAHHPNLPKADIVSADIPGVGKEVSSTSEKRG